MFSMTPNPCYEIADVSIDGVSQGAIASYEFKNADANHEIVVSFTSKTYLIKLGKTVGGTILPSGNSVSPSEDETLSGIVNVLCGYWLTVKITPEACYEIKEIRVDGAAAEFQKKTDGSAQYDFTDGKEHRIDADFVKKHLDIEVSSEGVGSIEACSGDVCETIDLTDEKNKVNVECGADQTFEFTSSETGCQVAEVRVDGQVNGEAKSNCKYSFQSVKENHRLFVSFNTRIVKASAGDHGTIDPSGDVTVANGGKVSFTITPDETYAIAGVRIDEWSLDMANVSINEQGVGTYTFENVTEDRKIQALFTPLIITASAGDHGKIEQAGEVAVGYSEKVSFTITPDECYQISDVKADDVSVTEDVVVDEKGVGTYTFENVTQDHSIEATFECVKGDIDGDGSVTLKDAVSALKILAGREISVSLCQCVKIDLAEAVYVLNVLMEK